MKCPNCNIEFSQSSLKFKWRDLGYNLGHPQESVFSCPNCDSMLKAKYSGKNFIKSYFGGLLVGFIDLGLSVGLFKLLKLFLPDPQNPFVLFLLIFGSFWYLIILIYVTLIILFRLRGNMSLVIVQRHNKHKHDLGEGGRTGVFDKTV